MGGILGVMGPPEMGGSLGTMLESCSILLHEVRLIILSIRTNSSKTV